MLWEGFKKGLFSPRLIYSRALYFFSISDAVRTDGPADAEIEISGSVTFSAKPTFENLISTSVNNIDIGSCSAPKILTTNTCEGTDPQTITGTYTFNKKEAKKDLEVIKLNLEKNSKIDGNLWDNLLDKFVSRNEQTNYQITGKKTFKQNEFKVPKNKEIKVEFTSDVFGLTNEAPPIIQDLSFIGDKAGGWVYSFKIKFF